MVKNKPRIVYTYGVFDMLHTGHLKLLQQARGLAGQDGLLIVGVFTDEVAESFKRKPIISENQRRQIVEALGIVDVAVIQDDMSPQSAINFLKADIVCKAEGAGWDKNNVPQFEGAESIFLQYTDGVSTSDIIKECKKR